MDGARRASVLPLRRKNKGTGLVGSSVVKSRHGTCTGTSLCPCSAAMMKPAVNDPPGYAGPSSAD
jgi:GTP cyclohydrolase FolE2